MRFLLILSTSSLQDACLLDAVLTVVDAKHVTQHLDEEKPEGVVNEAVQQVGGRLGS